VFLAALASGFGHEDFCSSIKVLEAWAGIEVKRRQKNTNFSCKLTLSILELEASRGGNSHQSETNL